MPEGDTLRRLADRITAGFAGQVVERSELRTPRLAGRDLAGLVLLEADAYGKHLFVRFDDDRSLHAHLRMDGSFTLGRRSREPEWKRHVELWFSGGRLTGESVPILELVATAAERTITDPLGPDLCRPVEPPDPAEIASRMRSSPSDPLAGSMLDQRNAAGFGNIYATEVPFLVGVSPFQPVGSIERLDELVAIGVALIRTNARLGPQNRPAAACRPTPTSSTVSGAARAPSAVSACVTASRPTPRGADRSHGASGANPRVNQRWRTSSAPNASSPSTPPSTIYRPESQATLLESK